MNGIPLSKKEVQQIKFLRQTGHTISEIQKIIPRGKTTIFYHIKGVRTLPTYQDLLKSKQNGSKKQSEEDWVYAGERARALFSNFGANIKILISAMLYWGEGAKRDFSLSNTDPKLIRVFVNCLKELGIQKNDLRVTIRAYEDLDAEALKHYWARIIGIPVKQILNVNILKGKKKGKLQYGMCRIRVTKGGVHLKLFKSIIELVSEQLTPS